MPSRVFPAFALVLLLAVSLGASEPAGWSVSILAVTDARGELHVCDCPGLDFGGPALRGGLHKMARAWAVPTLFVDGGDFGPPPGDRLAAARADLALETLELLHLDAVAVGETDWARGREHLTRAASRLPLVCANLQGVAGIPAYRWMKAGDRRVALVGVLDPAGLVPGDSMRVIDPVPAVLEVLKSVRPEADLVVLLAHATAAQVAELLPQLPGVDVAVAGHPTEDTRILERMGDIPVLVPRAGAREAVQLTLTRDAAGGLSDLRPRPWNLKDIPRGDARIEQVTRAFEERWGLR
jgi:2',3'-cyclic-nucleotide 2'-phosphodiesterase (5'-nucleotidase family)